MLVQSNSDKEYTNYVVFFLIIFSIAYSLTRAVFSMVATWKRPESQSKLDVRVGREPGGCVSLMAWVLFQGVFITGILGFFTFLFLNVSILELYPLSKWAILLVASIHGVFTGLEAESEKHVRIGTRSLNPDEYDKSFSSILPAALFVILVLCPIELSYNLTKLPNSGIIFAVGFFILVVIFIRFYGAIVDSLGSLTDVGFRRDQRGRLLGLILTIAVAQALTTWDQLMTIKLSTFRSTYLDASFLVLFSGVAFIRILNLLNRNLSAGERIFSGAVVCIFIGGKIMSIGQ